MLTRLDFGCFKCFKLLKLSLAPLTLLSGTNASGKSSVLQALVLLHQTMREHEWSTRLILNGDAIRMGTVYDVIDKIHGRRSFDIGVMDEDKTYRWTFRGEREDLSLSIDKVISGDRAVDSPAALRYLLPPDAAAEGDSLVRRLLHLTYITAERVGPREVYPLDDRQVATVVGPSGERAVSVLHWGGDNPVPRGLELPDAPNTLPRQVEERMRRFFPGFAMMLNQIPQTNAVTFGMRTSDDTDFHRPVHAGFGLTQVFPIVVAALSARENDLLLIENPEVHLHPAGQAQMGAFLAEVARAGVQVIVETHSDHILNGIRRAVKAKRLEPEQVAIHFFRPRSESAAQVESLQIDPSGNIDSWPEGFFDQFDKDMNHFAGWGE